MRGMEAFDSPSYRVGAELIVNGPGQLTPGQAVGSYEIVFVHQPVEHDLERRLDAKAIYKPSVSLNFVQRSLIRPTQKL